MLADTGVQDSLTVINLTMTEVKEPQSLQIYKKATCPRLWVNIRETKTSNYLPLGCFDFKFILVLF